MIPNDAHLALILVTGQARLCGPVPSLLSMVNFWIFLDEALFSGVSIGGVERLYGRAVLVVGGRVIVIVGHVEMFRSGTEGHHGIHREGVGG